MRHQPVAARHRHRATHFRVAMLVDVRQVDCAVERRDDQQDPNECAYGFATPCHVTEDIR
jgi:hypothetical protein